jgi:hypothetical protein
MALNWTTDRVQKFNNDKERIKFLFGLYEEYLGGY